MAEDTVELQKRLREKGLTCPKLRSMIKDKQSDARTFRKVGFNQLAQKEEDSARLLRATKNKVCRKL